MEHKWRTLLLLALAELLAMVVWFSASAVTPALQAEWSLSTGQQAWLTNAVQIGFVVGAFTSALFSLADRISAKWFFIGATFTAAAATALIPTIATGPNTALALRFITGVSLAGVYPVGMKLMATWTKADRGLGIGLLVGALTVGSAAPHLLAVFGGVENWRLVLYLAAVLAAVGAIIGIVFIKEGPYSQKSAKFRFGDIKLVLTNRPVMLANLGYLGHMWELYAMWAWLSAFLVASFAVVGIADHWASLVTFGAIALGGIASVLAGLLADRIGRVEVTTASMAISGTCALLIGRLFGGNPVLLTVVALVWGFTIVADSAQFSASVSELAQKHLLGTALTLQTSLGFLLTLFTIRMLPVVQAVVGWEWAFAFLAFGPMVGIWAMLTLKRLSTIGFGAQLEEVTS